MTMRFYKLHRTHDAGVSAGFEFFATIHEARTAEREWMAGHKGVDADNGSVGVELTVIDIPFTKAGILRALNLYANHNDNG